MEQAGDGIAGSRRKHLSWGPLSRLVVSEQGKAAAEPTVKPDRPNLALSQVGQAEQKYTLVFLGDIRPPDPPYLNPNRAIL